jgi:hypothetical protein
MMKLANQDVPRKRDSLRRIPGFTAEASFYSSGTQYQASVMLPGVRPERVVQPALPNDPCATARRIYESNMNDARFWIVAGDRLAAAGLYESANLAGNEADYYLGLANDALGDMSAAC